MDRLTFEGKEYVSSKRASSITGYTKDYIGQLCRLGKLSARMVGRNWYVALSTLEKHKKTYKQEIEIFQHKETDTESETIKEDAIATADVSPKSETKVEISELGHYPRQMIEEAVPLRYEADERPLIPYIGSKKKTVNVIQIKSRSAPEGTISSAQRTHADHSRGHATVGAGEVIPDPFEIAQFEREIATQQPISYRRENISEASGNFDDTDEKVSNSRTVHRKLHIVKLCFMTALLFLVPFYGSVFVVKQLVYERTTNNDYVLVSSKLLCSGYFK